MTYNPSTLLHNSMQESKRMIRQDGDNTIRLTEESHKYHEQRIQLIRATLSEMEENTMQEAVELLKEKEKNLDTPFKKKPLRAGVLSGAQKEDYNKNDLVEPTSPENEDYEGRPEDEEDMIL